ncbi:MAG: hypothetical protein HY820_38330 [Acidobacteria bacterium]|nr:hypothetical protein [Acidobacteriota bacterium]
MLIWFRLDKAGVGRIVWSQGDAGQQGLELLIGSDPELVPMRINRWGYISESHTRQTADVFGVMTQTTEEKSADEAEKKLKKLPNSGHPYRAIRSRITAGESATTITQLVLPGKLTFRELDLVRNEVSHGTGRTNRSLVPKGVDRGFLSAVAGLLSTSASQYSAGKTLARGLNRNYVYANTLYDITLRETKHVPDSAIAHCHHKLLESEFVVRNHTTRRRTEFRLLYGVTPPLAGIPVRVVFRPNWWFEAELNLDANQWR